MPKLTSRKRYGIASLLFLVLGYTAYSIHIHKSPANTYQTYYGYVEGVFIRVSSPVGGILETLKVKEGDHVDKNAPLALLEKANEDASEGEILYHIKEEESKLAFAQEVLKRREILSRNKQDSVENYQDAKASAEGSQARLEALRYSLKKARWVLSMKSINAPCASKVIQKHFNEGEYVAPGSPVLTLFPKDSLKVKFFVSLSNLPHIQYGSVVEISCSGYSTPLKGAVSFISPEAEYTPPVLYTTKEREKMVFMVEVNVRGNPLISGLILIPKLWRRQREFDDARILSK
ncbi:MAG: HlyD family efflux transporter periplasmic adaptor subunit [Alphaproteobacteria bacterium]|nr:HlyD family efflux transporter periplasmic adaptor subunit [Alphaproteobacteria bacterium]